LANLVARAIGRAFDQCQHEFHGITRRAKRRFAERDWAGMRADSAQRLDVYELAVERIVARSHLLLGERVRSRLVWTSAKAVYSGLINDRDDWEIAETFFNSVTRRIFTTVGVDEEIEFVHTDYDSPPTPAKSAVYRTYTVAGSLAECISRLLGDYQLPLGDEDRAGESELAAAEIERRVRWLGQGTQIDRIEMASSAFYRDGFAYLVGRMVAADQTVPLVLCLRSARTGVFLDAVLSEQDDVSLLFSFARSYFHVQTPRPYDLVRFIKTIIPRKPTAEIYISIGYNKHGKTELYRHALRHLARTSDKYQLAAGERGMVMAVFTMPSYPVVFKIIKDKFDYPKQTTRQAVIDRYRLVFKHDRAGRLIDAQEYRFLELDRHRFCDQLLAELLAVAAQNVSVAGDRVVIEHCYAERRVTPLGVYLAQADQQAAEAAVIDYGQAIKDLAVTNIFPGDLMLKNFGVTRQRRVVFYDYDEVCLLSDCTIRKLPAGDDYDDEIADEPWFAVGRYDIFPEEFSYFLGLAEPLRSVFLAHHAELLTVDYWLDIQRRLRAGQSFPIAPYGQHRRLPRVPWHRPPQRAITRRHRLAQ
jgi:isocitrate dehydrogenase kinase/phosphatase